GPASGRRVLQEGDLAAPSRRAPSADSSGDLPGSRFPEGSGPEHAGGAPLGGSECDSLTPLGSVVLRVAWVRCSPGRFDDHAKSKISGQVARPSRHRATAGALLDNG